jgi:cytochrome subunit of sulfide dehydrogenase
MKTLAVFLGLGVAASLYAAENAPHRPAVPYFASNCFNCHGTEGRINSAIPAIAGRDREFLEEALKAYKAGSKPATIMHQLAKGYTDQEIAVLADYFSRQK